MKFPNALRVITLKNILARKFKGEIIHEADYYILKYLSKKLRFRFHAKGMSLNDYLAALYKGKADIGVARLGNKEEVGWWTGFTAPYSVLNIGFVARKPEEVHKFEVFAHPFSPGVWIACLVVLLLATWFCKWITATRMTNTLLSLFGSMLRQPLDIDIGTLDRRVWWSIWWIYSVVVSTVYVALLFSFVTMPTKGQSVKTFQQLSVAVVNNKFKVHAIKNLCLKALRTDGQQLKGPLRVLGEEILKNGWLLDEMEQPLIDKTSAWIGDIEYLRHQIIRPFDKAKVYS